MKSIKNHINESLSNEILDLRKKLSKLDKSKIFNGLYNLDDSLDKEFYNILVSLNKSNASNNTLISTWKMLFSKLIIEPLVGELIGDSKCEYSSINTDRTEKWYIRYNKNILIDVKATYNNHTNNFDFSKKDVDYIINYNNQDINKKYVLFVYPEIKTWEDAIKIYKDKSMADMKLISYIDFKEILDTNDFEEKKSNIMIPYYFVENNNKFMKFNKLKLSNIENNE